MSTLCNLRGCFFFFFFFCNHLCLCVENKTSTIFDGIRTQRHRHQHRHREAGITIQTNTAKLASRFTVFGLGQLYRFYAQRKFHVWTFCILANEKKLTNDRIVLNESIYKACAVCRCVCVPFMLKFIEYYKINYHMRHSQKLIAIGSILWSSSSLALFFSLELINLQSSTWPFHTDLATEDMEKSN